MIQSSTRVWNEKKKTGLKGSVHPTAEVKAPSEIDGEKSDDSKDDDKKGWDANDDIPEPQEVVNFFVDNVQGKNTQPVDLFRRPRVTELGESTFGHFGKNWLHRVDRLFRPIHDHAVVEVLEEVVAVAHESASEEGVGHRPDQQKDDPIQDLAEEEVQSVSVVPDFARSVEVVQPVNPHRFFVLINCLQ